MNSIEQAAAIGEFLQILFGDQQRGTLFLSGGPRAADGKVHPWIDTPYDLARVKLERIAIEAKKRSASAEVYFSCALFSGQKRIEAQAVVYPFLYADIDLGTFAPTVPRPTVVIESSPNRRQAFWKLHKATTREFATDLNRRLAAACSADMSGWDATQVLRLPGLRNHKYPGVFSLIEDISDRTYDTEDFGHLAMVQHVVPAHIALTGGADGMSSLKAAWPYLSRKMRACAGGDSSAYRGDESSADHALMCSLIGAGLTPDEAVAAFDVTPRGQALALRKGEDHTRYLLDLSVRKAVSLVGQVQL